MPFMRIHRAARAAMHLLAAVALATCSDGPTGPRQPKMARVAFAPVFSAEAAAAAAELQEAGIGVISVKVKIYRPGSSEILVERSVDVGPGQSSVTLEIDVAIQGHEELLEAKLQFRDAQGRVLYEGTKSIIARAGTSSSAEVPQTVIEYVGPGAGATTLTLAPADTTIASAVTMRATATDAAGKTVEAPLVIWTSSAPAVATVSPAGVVTPVGAAGMTTIGAKIPSGVSATAVVRVAARPAMTITRVSGDAQADTVDALLPAPLVVEVRDATGAPVTGQVIAWRALWTAEYDGEPWPNVLLNADPTLPEMEQEWYDSLETTTDAQGRAFMHVRLGSSAQHAATVRATVVGHEFATEFNLTVRVAASPGIAFPHASARRASTWSDSPGSGFVTSPSVRMLSPAIAPGSRWKSV